MAIEQLLLERLYLLGEASVLRDLTLDSALHDGHFNTEAVRLRLDLCELLPLASDKRLFLCNLLPLGHIACVRPRHLRSEVSVLVPIVAPFKRPRSDARLLKRSCACLVLLLLL